MSAPIDTQYYTITGPAKNFDGFFSSRICSEDDLGDRFHQGLVNVNGGGQQGNDCAGMVGFAPPTVLVFAKEVSRFMERPFRSAESAE